MTSTDTICAISTPAGCGGIAVIRISGTDAFAITDKIWKGKPLDSVPSHTVHLGSITDTDGNILDQCIATVFKAPHSFTGENTVELSIHGSRWLQRETLATLVKCGAHIAAPGEFSQRAFAAGKLDLAQAEAVADLIASTSRASHRIAMSQMRGGLSQRLSELREQLLRLASLLELELDFSEEQVEFASRTQLLELSTAISAEIKRLLTSFHSGAAIKDGIPVAITGRTNAGKSSLLNAIVGDDRAIVSDIHGTTRDIVEDTAEIGDYLFRFMDTAGLRRTDDTIENLGIARSHEAAAKAHIILYVVDGTKPINSDDIQNLRRLTGDIATSAAGERQIIVIANKSDIAENPDSILNQAESTISDTHPTLDARYIKLSTKNYNGIDNLKQALVDFAEKQNGTDSDEILLTNARHAEELTLAGQSIDNVIAGLTADLPGDLVAQDLRIALHHLGTITGEITTPDILANIFSHFCIGK